MGRYQPFHIIYEGKNIRLEGWGQGGTAHLDQDDWFFAAQEEDLFRVAVLDGVTPWRAASPGSFDPAMWATGVIRTALKSELPAREALREANAELYRQELPYTRMASSACLSLVDVHVAGKLLYGTAWAAGDSEAWALIHGGWEKLVGGEAIDTHQGKAWKTWLKENPTADPEYRHLKEAEMLNEISAWSRTAIGRFPEPKLENKDFADVKEIVLGTDGAELSRWHQSSESLNSWVLKLSQRDKRDDYRILSIRAKTEY